MFDKRQLIRKQPTNIKQDDLSQADRLLKLAEQFAKFTTGKEKAPELIDEYIVEGEWEEVKEYKGKDDGMQT